MISIDVKNQKNLKSSQVGQLQGGKSGDNFWGLIQSLRFSFFLDGVPQSYKEPVRPTKSELDAQHIKTPASFYQLHAERLYERGDDYNPHDSVSYRHHVTNPNIINRAINLPTISRCSMRPGMKTEMMEIVVNALEKHHWQPEKVANAIKVDQKDSYFCGL